MYLQSKTKRRTRARTRTRDEGYASKMYGRAAEGERKVMRWQKGESEVGVRKLRVE